eukprot:SAG31_NODE_23525_length_502_cov_1.121588_1_plen_39_part_10
MRTFAEAAENSAGGGGVIIIRIKTMLVVATYAYPSAAQE